MRISELDYSTRICMACDLDTSQAVLDALARDDEALIRVQVAENPRTSLLVLGQLFDDDVDFVRNEALRNLNVTSKTLDRLAHDEKMRYHYRNIAKDSRTSPETLDYLANDVDECVREAVAQNVHTSPETLDRLARDKFDWIHVEVAKNPITDTETLDYLLANSEKSRYVFEIYMAIASNPNASKEALDQLAQSEDERIRSVVAEKRKYSLSLKPKYYL